MAAIIYAIPWICSLITINPRLVVLLFGLFVGDGMSTRACSKGLQRSQSEVKRFMNHDAVTWDTLSAGTVGGMYVFGVGLGGGGANRSR